MIVVDIGSKTHTGEESIEKLVERFHPTILYGFDPHHVTGPDGERWKIGSTEVWVQSKAAWIYDGSVPFRLDGSASTIGLGTPVECFDLCAFLAPKLATGYTDVVLKLDCEGAEFTLINALRSAGLLEQLKLLLVEWHLPCPFEEW